MMKDRERINYVFDKLFSKEDKKDYTADEMLEELAEVLPELYREYKKLTEGKYITHRLSDIKGELEYISDRWTTPERVAFIITAIQKRTP